MALEEAEIQELFDQAARLASRVPEPMQSAAFERAVELLSDGSRTAVSKQPKRPESSRKETDSTPGQQLLAGVDRTKYPQIATATRVRDRALWVLRIASDEFGFDALSATDIANVLTKKFKLKTKRNAVHMALERAGEFVNTRTEGRSTLYELMDPGEQYLDGLGTSSG